jgi:hypothetical protein
VVFEGMSDLAGSVGGVRDVRHGITAAMWSKVYEKSFRGAGR